MQAIPGHLALDESVGAALFFTAMIAWADRARRGTGATTMGTSSVGGALAIFTSWWIGSLLPAALSTDLAGRGVILSSGPLGGWLPPFVATALFAGAARSEGTPLRWSKPWDAPLTTGPPAPEPEPPVTTPPDRIPRSEQLRNEGTISGSEFAYHRARTPSPDHLVGPVPVPPNSGSRAAARARPSYLAGSGAYRPRPREEQEGNVLRAYGHSRDLLFPEEERRALRVRARAIGMDPDERARRQREILERIGDRGAGR